MGDTDVTVSGDVTGDIRTQESKHKKGKSLPSDRRKRKRQRRPVPGWGAADEGQRRRQAAQTASAGRSGTLRGRNMSVRTDPQAASSGFAGWLAGFGIGVEREWAA